MEHMVEKSEWVDLSHKALTEKEKEKGKDT